MLSKKLSSIIIYWLFMITLTKNITSQYDSEEETIDKTTKIVNENDILSTLVPVYETFEKETVVFETSTVPLTESLAQVTHSEDSTSLPVTTFYSDEETSYITSENALSTTRFISTESENYVEETASLSLETESITEENILEETKTSNHSDIELKYSAEAKEINETISELTEEETTTQEKTTIPVIESTTEATEINETASELIEEATTAHQTTTSPVTESTAEAIANDENTSELIEEEITTQEKTTIPVIESTTEATEINETTSELIEEETTAHQTTTSPVTESTAEAIANDENTSELIEEETTEATEINETTSELIEEESSTSSSKYKTAKLGEMVILECITDDLIDEVHWEKENGHTETLNSSSNVVLDNKKLIIYPLAEADFGNYKCFGRNSNDTQEIDSVEIAKKVDQTSDSTSIYGDTITLKSNISKNYKSGTIYWRKIQGNESEFNIQYYYNAIRELNVSADQMQKRWKELFGLNSERMSIKEGELIIKYLNKEDYGVYESVLVYESFKSSGANKIQFLYFKDKVNFTESIQISSYIDEFMSLYGNWSQTVVDESINESQLNQTVELSTVLSKEHMNGLVIWRKVSESDDSFYINSFYERLTDNKLSIEENYNLLNLNANKTRIEEGKLIIKSFSEEDYGLYECIFIYETKSDTYQIISNNKTYRIITIQIRNKDQVEMTVDLVNETTLIDFTTETTNETTSESTDEETTAHENTTTIPVPENTAEVTEINETTSELIEEATTAHENTTTIPVSESTAEAIANDETTSELIISAEESSTEEIDETTTDGSFDFSTIAPLDTATSKIEKANYNQIDLRSGNSIKLWCNFNDQFSNEIQWRKIDSLWDEKVDDNTTANLFNSSNTQISGSNLDLFSLKPEDSGIYECFIYKEAKFESFRFILNITNWNTETSTPQAETTKIVTETFYTFTATVTSLSHNETRIPIKSCQPNERKCNNGHCVGKIWWCDGEPDCDDESDEIECISLSLTTCKSYQFECKNITQCVSKGSQCDKVYDCEDETDENACEPPRITKFPIKSIEIEVGETFSIECAAVGSPIPLINWRMDMYHTCEEPRCHSTNSNGYGVFTVTDARLEDAGIYSCEAINSMGRVFVYPETDVVISEAKEPKETTMKTVPVTEEFYDFKLSTSEAASDTEEKLELTTIQEITSSSTTATISTATSLTTITNERHSHVFVVIVPDCLCNGHSNACTCSSNKCIKCEHNTEGDHCQYCKPGYVGDATLGNANDCKPINSSFEMTTIWTPPRELPIPSVNIQSQCNCNGHALYCDCDGKCLGCMHNTIGDSCEKCDASFIGDATKGTPFDCLPENTELSREPISKCFCNGLPVSCEPSKSYYRKIGSYYEKDTWTLTNKYLNLKENVISDKDGISYDKFNGNDQLYFRLPSQYRGNRILLYNGELSFTFMFKLATTQRKNTIEQLEIRISGAKINLIHVYPKDLVSNAENQITIKMNESNFRRFADNSPIEREFFLLTLTDIDFIMIKAKLSNDQISARLSEFSIEYADSSYSETGALASSIEVCNCPTGYSGTSCESCAPGYERKRGELFAGLCQIIN